jgi:hypothetical protein
VRRLFACALFIVVLPFSSFSQCRENVSGQVLDESGNPLGGALVSFAKVGAAPGHHVIQTFESLADGSFNATVDGSGTYLALAKKESSGYPETRMAFYNTVLPTKVTVTCQEPLSGVVIKMNPQVGRLGKVTVIDAVTGSSVQNAAITLRRLSSPDLYITTSTTYRDIAVPSDTDVIYEVSAPGYVTSAPQALVLKPGEHTDLRVVLRLTQ